ncbi:MAG: RNA polymerase sigma factor [Actinobacteria bacterium]|nr:RNA polymerase sigma factor [Actinomycetota bacterium]
MLSADPSPTDPEEPRSQAEFDEEELVRRAQLGSAAAFEQLVVARGPQLYRYLAARLCDESDARDALQETLAAAWQGLPTLRSRSRFWPWVVGIATHKAADVARGRVRATEREPEAPAPDEDSAAEIREALAVLPDRFRQVLLLRYVLHLSEDEVASALGVRVGTVKSRSARARKALEELLR